MYQVQQLTDDFKQRFTVTLLDGNVITFQLEYKPLQRGWFITLLNYGDFNLYNTRLVTSPNMLNQFRNVIPFGLKCEVQQNDEPTLQQDLLSERVKLYVLTPAEVAAFGDFLSGQASA